MTDLSRPFGEILRDFRFPKLEGPHLDRRYVPQVRGLPYSRIGSAGATTLLSLVWCLAVFERVVETEEPHPGLLLIDSPQKNLLSKENQPPDEYQTAAIGEAVYRHLLTWADSDAGRNAQIVVVDNAPQPIAEDWVVVDYSGDPARSPYGLIDDAVE